MLSTSVTVIHYLIDAHKSTYFDAIHIEMIKLNVLSKKSK